MKALFSLMLFMSFVFNDLAAQTKIDSWMLGGQMYGKKSGKEFFAADINVNLGYFIANNLAVGARTGLLFEKLRNDKSLTSSLGIFGRYYLRPEKMLKPITELGFGYQNSSIVLNEVKGNSYNYYGQVGLGLAYFLSEDASIEGILNINSAFTDFDILEVFTVKDNDLKIGIQIYF